MNGVGRDFQRVAAGISNRFAIMQSSGRIGQALWDRMLGEVHDPVDDKLRRQVFNPIKDELKTGLALNDTWEA